MPTHRQNFGALNSHATGIIMRELSGRAIREIRRQRFNFESNAKVGYSGKLDDLVTSADKAAEHIYVKSLKECFPDIGIIGEEGNRKNPAKNKRRLWWTVDPLDGTKAFERRQSHGVGTMLALISPDEVLAAIVGDVNTGEMYYYRPGSRKVWRLSPEDPLVEPKELKPNTKKSLADCYIVLRQHPLRYSTGAKRFTLPYNHSGIAKDIDLMSGSIGLDMARLWKGEAAAMLLKGDNYETPWDSNPVIGISQKLGFVFLAVNPVGGGLTLLKQRPVFKVFRREYEVLVIHRDYLPTLQALRPLTQ